MKRKRELKEESNSSNGDDISGEIETEPQSEPDLPLSSDHQQEQELRNRSPSR